MKNKTPILILVLMLLVIPTSTVLACGNLAEDVKTENISCSKEDSHSEKKSCCDNEENDDGCGGACDSSSCHCPNSINIPIFFNDLKLTYSNNSTLLDNDWAYLQHVPKTVYLSIWQPPKIN